MDATISDGPWYNITTPNKHDDSDVLNQTVTGLKIFTPYLFRILAFTYKSEGILSDNVTVWTDEDGELFIGVIPNCIVIKINVKKSI